MEEAAPVVDLGEAGRVEVEVQEVEVKVVEEAVVGWVVEVGWVAGDLVEEVY